MPQHAFPSYASNPAPTYPESAGRAGHEGVAPLLVSVAQDGLAAKAAILESSGLEERDEAAVDVVESWTFRPAGVGGHTVESPVEVATGFSLLSFARR